MTPALRDNSKHRTGVRRNPLLLRSILQRFGRNVSASQLLRRVVRLALAERAPGQQDSSMASIERPASSQKRVAFASASGLSVTEPSRMGSL